MWGSLLCELGEVPWFGGLGGGPGLGVYGEVVL